jgi:hypothetical protein
MCELSDIIICSFGGIRGNLRNFGGNAGIVEFSITLVDKFADMAAVKCNMESSLAHTNDVGRMAVMLGPRILALHVIIDVEDVSGESREGVQNASWLMLLLMLLLLGNNTRVAVLLYPLFYGKQL